MIDLEKEREAFKVFKERELQPPSEHDLFLTWLYRACRAEDKFLKMKKEIVDLKAQLAELHASRASWVEYSQKIESGEFVLVRRVISGSTRYHIDNLIQANTSISDEGVNWMDSLPDMIIEAMIEAVEKDHE